MENKSLYIRELEAIVCCHQSDGYLKQWALEKLEDFRLQQDFKELTSKILITTG